MSLSSESSSSTPADPPSPLPDRYTADQTWRWNLTHPPRADIERPEVAEYSGNWNWCGLKTNSPLAVAAGPLLNGRWLLYYARRGFDILVYKTVRTSPRECYPLPNLVPVAVDRLDAPDSVVPQTAAMEGSWAVSFGMPSLPPTEWRKDIRVTVSALQPGQILVVSVVGTQQEAATAARSLDLLADDYAECAQLAVGAGAHGIEANFSCPNVSTDDGQLYQNAEMAGIVAQRIRSAIGSTPLVLKIGHLDVARQAEALLKAVAPHVDGLAMTNALSAHVRAADGTLLFDGARRGICGDAIRTASQRQVAMFADSIRQHGFAVQLHGVGGVSALDHVDGYLNAGAATVAMATAPMIHPAVAQEIRKARRARSTGGS